MRSRQPIALWLQIAGAGPVEADELDECHGKLVGGVIIARLVLVLGAYQNAASLFDAKGGNLRGSSSSNVNTMGPLRVTEAFIDHLSRSERKLAVTITSIMGSLARNHQAARLLIAVRGRP